MKTLFLSVIFILFSLSAISETDPKSISSMVQKGDAVLIDVREKDEIKSGMLMRAKWFPLSKLKNNKNWKADFTKLVGGKKIFLYCRSGRRSGKVMKILKEHGIASENIGGYKSLKAVLPASQEAIE